MNYIISRQRGILKLKEMESINLIRKKMLSFGKNFEVSVSGNSMEPMIRDGDTIEIIYVPKCMTGDVVVFVYDYNILVHRILKIENDIIYCKGDNAFRLEKIGNEQVIGKVTAVNGRPILKWDERKREMAYEIHRVFCDCKYNVERTKQTSIYKQYENLILKE